MRVFLERAAEFVRSEEGPTATEYAVMIAVICVAAIGALSQFGVKVGNIYTAVQGTMPSGGGS